MRHLKADVSHRIKRRPSIFTALWFRTCLGVGGVVIAGLLLGPSVAHWLRGDTRAGAAAIRSTVPSPRPPEPAVAAALKPADPALAPPLKPADPPSPAPAANGATTTPEVAATPKAEPVPATKPEVLGARREASAPRPEAPAPRADAAAASRGVGLYRIQVGAFLDHRNADKLMERLRSDGLEVVGTMIEEGRPLYRVLALPADGEGYPALAERLRALGLGAEVAEGGAAVGRPAPLASAVEVSRRLRGQGIRIRLERQASASAFRVVRIGGYETAEEAERVRAELAARGYDGIVVRESR
jgi:cell division septation protein DedD